MDTEYNANDVGVLPSVTTYFGLFELVRRLPAVTNGRSLENLQIFIRGWEFCYGSLSQLPVNDGDEYRAFGKWVHERFDDDTTISWTTVISARIPNADEAWDAFQRLVDEWLAARTGAVESRPGG